LEELPTPLRRGLIRRGAFRLRPGLRDVDFDALEEAAAAITPPQASTSSRVGGLVEIAGGLRLEIEADTVFLTGQGIELPAGEWPQVTGDTAQTWKWETRGQIELAGGLVLEGEIRELDGSLETTLRQFLADATLKLGKMDEVRRAALPEFTAWLSADVAGEVLEIRTPQPGDRVEPLGMGGKRVKLSDLFINNRIPKRLRAKWPLVCVGEQIAWVPGLRAAERFRLREKLPARVWRLVVRPEADQKQGVPRSAKGAKRKIRTSAEKADS
jgi:tRNA(Ile)-lysidine synthetase-like protein